MKYKTNYKREKNIPNLRYYAAMFALITGLITISHQTARAGSLFEMMNDLLGNLISTNDNAAGLPPCVNNPVVHDGSDSGEGSLRQAVIDACPGSTITFSNTILNTGEAVNTITLVSGQITIDKNLTIQGPGASEFVIKSNGNRSFQISGAATATISGVTISFGGISNSGNLTVADSVISKSPSSRGGGIYSNGNLTVINSTIESNSANGNGGGLYLNSGNTTLMNTTVSGNEAFGQYGGGIYNTSSSILTITSSTIVNNKIVTSSNIYMGGGIYNEQSGAVNIRNSILAGNNGLFAKDFFGTLTSQGYNLIGAQPASPSLGTITGDTTGNIVGTNSNPVKASLAMLTFYGGETSTHALLSDSPAVNAGDPGISMPDQRGAARVGRPDIGAFEVNNSQNGGNFVAVLPDGLTDNAYRFILIHPYERYPPGGGNTPPTRYDVTGGTLPSGFELKVTDPIYTDTAVDGYLWIKGLTSTGGNFNFTITATDHGTSSVTDYSLRILVPTPPPPPGECIVNPVVLNKSDNAAGSLRHAVRDACPDSTITFSDNVSGVILIKSGSIAIGKNLTIQGPGTGRLTLQKSSAFEGEAPAPPGDIGPPIFYIHQGVTATISRLTITGINYLGPATGIENYGNLTLTDTNISFFSSTGVFNHRNLNINKSIIFSNNRSGIDQSGTSLTINDSEISYNYSYRRGGGIWCGGGTLNINNSNISQNNVLGSGGGLLIESNCNATVTNTNISHNVQKGFSLDDGGGGIRVNSGTLTVTNSTIVNNISASTSASGGLGNLGGGIGNGVFGSNFAGIVSVRNSIIAGNISRGESLSARTFNGPDFYGPMTSQGYNLIGNNKDATITGDTTGNIVGTNASPINPQITPLGFHGGSTRIHALFSNSPAVNAGDPGLSTPDQRGAARVGRPDIGAFELNNAANGGSFVAVLPDGRPQNYYEYELVKYDTYRYDEITGSYDRTTYELTSGALPPGITLTTTPPVYNRGLLISQGFVRLSGTTNVSGIYNFSITATDGDSSNVTDYSVRFGTLTPNPTPTITPTPTVTPTPTPTPPSPYGSFDAANCSSISGWAWDPQQPNTPISVNIYADDNLVATVSADQFRQDLLDAGIGNGVHGFSLATPESLKDGQPHQIRVRIVSTSSEIDNSPQSFTCESPTPTPTATPTPTPTPTPVPPYGSFDAANCSSISGWAWDPQQPNTPISVNIYADDNLVATVSADQFRQDLLDAGIGNGVHGFSLATPESLKDGQPHQIRVRIVSNLAEIDSSPKTINCATPPDLTVTKTHTGDFTQGDNGRTYSIVVTNSGGTATSGTVSMSDSLPAGLTATAISGTDWNCNFSNLTCSRNDALAGNSSYPQIILTVNVAANAPASVTNSVQVSGGGEINTENNSASDQTTINTAPLRGNFDSADCSTIAGWAWDPQQPNTPISVNIYADDNLVATISADQFRQDLLDAGIGNGVHGFSLATPESLKDGQPHQIRVRIVSNLAEIDSSPKTITCAAPRYSISGSAFYGNTDAGQPVSTVAGVRLNVTGEVSAELFTDSMGNYFIADLPGGNYTVTPSKTGDVRGINSLDATRIQQHLVGLTTLSPNRLIAADTDGNGVVNSLDAARIQQSLIGMQTSNIIGQWKFVPGNRQYNSLNSDLSGQDYQAILVGEVSGNWATAYYAEIDQTEEEILTAADDQNQTAERFTDELFRQDDEKANRRFESSAKESPTGESFGSGIQVSLPSDAMGENGSPVTIPVTIGGLYPDDLPLESFDFAVFYDPAVLQPAVPSGGNTGTLSANCSVLSNSPVAGRVIVSGACAQAITVGSGVLYNLTFNVIGEPNQTTNLSFDNPANNFYTFQFNNGLPFTNSRNGRFLVLGPTAASVTVSGRVLTPDGRGLMNSVVVMTDSAGSVRTARTGSFGYFLFDNVEAGQIYFFSVKSKSYTFAPQAITVMDDVRALSFRAL